MSVFERIKQQEEKYRILMSKLIRRLTVRCEYVNIESTPIWCHVDLKVTADTSTMDIEIKERNEKTYSQYIPLKVKKYKNMLKDHFNKKLLYVSFVNNEKAYIFDLTNLDLNKEKKEIWHIKKTQFDRNSPIEETEMILLNKDNAYKVIEL